MNRSKVDVTRFFELSIDMLCIAGVDGYFKQVNPSFLSTLGYDEPTMLCKPFIEFVHPDDVASTLDETKKLADGIPTRYFENRYLCQNGEYKWLAWTAHPTDGLLYCVARDISAQKQMQFAFQKSQNRFKAILEMASVGIIAINRQGQIVLTNQKTREMFGYSNDELQDATLEMLLPDRFRQHYRQHREGFFAVPAARERGLKSDLLGRHKDGNEFPVEVSLSFVETNGGMMAMAFVIDISERKQVEVEREKLIDELEAFAHTVAHDLKSPLGLILGHTELLTSSLAELSSEAIESGLDTIRKTSHKMNDIINELLLLSTVRNKEKVDKKSIYMQDAVYEAKARLAHMIESHHALISMPTSWPMVTGYMPWIEEVWVNYLSNGIKYGGTPPQLEIGATVTDEGMVRFWVRDNGVGLTVEERTRLFAPFTRLNNKDGRRGHGLGLSIVKRIVEKLGGTVGVESSPNGGSTFYFLLPQAPSGEVENEK
ncbi:MAG: PAS domain S-box protein [Chloroflexi bacterium]|nr:PAS domain S-box protein [Chloroflexota bacterium]